MKKIFSFVVSNKNRARQTDSIKYDIKKYVARERRKKLPEGVDYWGFDCRIGLDASETKVIHLNDINKSITEIESEKVDSFYIEVLVKPGVRQKREVEKLEPEVLKTDDLD